MNLIKRTNRTSPVLESFFNDDFFNMPVFNFNRRNEMVPAVNIIEKEKEFQIEVAAPGFNKDDFKIELDNNILTISTTKEKKEEHKEDDYSCKEFGYYSFARSFSLPEDKVNNEKINAKYVNGILYVSIPKRKEEKAKPSRLIKIS